MKNALTRKILLVVLSFVLISSFAIGLSLGNLSNKAFAQNEASVFEMVEGAQIRLEEPTGLRFRAKMSADYYADLTAENTEDKLYVAIVPYAWYESYQNAEFEGVLCEYLAAQSTAFLNIQIPAEKIYSGGDGYYYANAVMSNVLFNNYNVPFVGVAYIQNGSDYIEVSALNIESARSVFTVSYINYSINEDLESEVFDEIFEKAIYNAKGVRYDTTDKKYIFNGEKYDSYTDICEVPSLENMILTVENNKKVLKGENFTLISNFKFSDGSDFIGDTRYVWESSNNAVATVDQNGNVTTLSDGLTEITVSAFGGDYTATCVVEVYSYEGMNLVAPAYYGSWTNTGITMEYVDDESAIKLTKLGANISGSHSHIEIAIMDEIRAAKTAGMKMLTFEFKAENLYGEGANNPIIWIMANDGTPNGVSSSYHIATPVNITADDDGEWVTVNIPFQDVHWLYSQNIDTEANTHFMLLFGGEQDGTILIRNMKFVNAEGYLKYTYTLKNFASSDYFTTWTNTGITMEYADDESAIKLTKLGANISGSHSHIEIAIMDEIRAAKTAGMKMLTFEFKAENLYGEGANNPTIWIMANDGTPNGVSSSYHIATPVDITAESEDKWVTAYIPFQDVYSLYSENINNANYEYLMLLIGGEKDGTIKIRNMKFGDATAYEKYTYASKNFASPEIVGKTDANSIVLEYDTTENAMKITKLYSGLSGSHSHVRMPIMDEIRKAKALGFTKLTLEYKANEGDLLWIMCNDGSDSSVGSGCWLTSGITVDGTLAGKWNKVEIDLSNSLIDVETNEYLMFLSGGSETGGSIYIRNIKVS